MPKKFRKSQPHQPIKNSIYVEAPEYPGQHARVESWDKEANLLILDRKIGPYWSYVPGQVYPLDIVSAAKAMVEDQKAGLL